MTMSMLGEVRPEHDRTDDGDLVLLHYLRSFHRPVLEVWTAATERAQLAQWLGAVTGEADTVTIEPLDGPVAGPITVRIEHCQAPHELAVRIDDCLVEVRMTQVGVVTNVELVRRHVCQRDAAAIGPRWQYLLDRLTAHLNQQPLPRWDGYPNLADEYR
ncbi:SRPBCC domain-containing protein [Nocardia brasiliensis]|uniref:SRPBCC domain-containing protein n=1 Tax=Nocardia brasiliensis TaxID=37326 RepID=UPI0004A74FB7|nr:SRPBCC domain-containing protein [Nocardia brasiliensis]MBF6126203.1 SRPBCC domain-containing protein [Nocardia brasiliensis]MBF6542788.1 SRPBCC domain-containing protein [Nocardia brasiliensis]